MGLEYFECIISQPKTEWSDRSSTLLRPFLFYVHPLDSSRIRIQVTDFHSSTWEAVRSVKQLEDMRDNIGIGGLWSEFVEYLIASIKSEDLKLVFEGQSTQDGPAYAKLVAQKSKGLPQVSISLNKLLGPAANEAMGNVSMELYKEYKTYHELLVKEQEGRYQLTEIVSAEEEKNRIIQSELDSFWSLKRRKSRNVNEKATSDFVSATSSQDSPVAGKQAGQNMGPTKGINRFVPSYRREEVGGILLVDLEDDAED